MRLIKHCFLIIFSLNLSILNGQLTPAEKGLQAITTDVIMAQLGFLASDWTEGRAAGEKGEYLAGDYIASMLRLFGVKPGGDILRKTNIPNSEQTAERSYFQNFVLIRSVPVGTPELNLKTISGEIIKTTRLTYNVDFTVRRLYRPVEIQASLVFAGYGFINEKIKYNDYSKIDIKGKFILKLSGYPAFADKKLSPAEINESLRYAENYVRKKGAAGIIEFSPEVLVHGNPDIPAFLNLSPSENNRAGEMTNAKYSLPEKTMPDEFLRMNISARAAEEIFKGSDINITEYIKKHISDNVSDIPVLKGRSVSFRSEMEISQVPVRNIIGIIDGKHHDQVIIIGAHYDHMGIRDGYIWNGADDNASGTVGAMTLAKALTATGTRPDKTIIIALWSSEELGLLGSEYFIKNPVVPLKDIRLNLNFDMISRYIADNNKKGVDMTYTASCPEFMDITEANLKKYGIDLEVKYHPSDNPPGGSDHRSFVKAGIPIMRFKPGHREEYHTPADEIHTVDPDIIEKIICISFLNIWELANNDW